MRGMCRVLLMGFWIVSVSSVIAQDKIDLYGVREEHTMIPMRDGTKLSAYLYFPSGDGPWPVLYEQRYADLKGVGTRQGNARLAKAGYVVCAENFRGAGKSEEPGSDIEHSVGASCKMATTRSNGSRNKNGRRGRSARSAVRRRDSLRTFWR